MLKLILPVLICCIYVYITKHMKTFNSTEFELLFKT